MASLNLSFKEWPFLPYNQVHHNKPFRTIAATVKQNEMLKPNLSLHLASSGNYSNMDLIQHSIHTHSYDEIPKDLKITNNLQHLSSWGRCGLFASTYKGCLSIYANDNKGCLTPMFMFSPFERYAVGQISKQLLKSTIITAVGWANGYLQPCISKPILAVSSEDGHILVYNIFTKEIIGKVHINDSIISILWSSNKVNRFYAGSKSGHLYICEVYKKTIQIIKSFDFYANSTKSSENMLKSVDFITQDDIDGLTVAIASKDGSIGFIKIENDIKQSKLQVFQNFNFIGSNNNSDIVVNFCEFYPNDQDFLIIATNTSTFLISISKGILLPFIQTQNSKFLTLLEKEKDIVVVCDDNDITVWRLVNQSWVRSYVSSIGGKYGFTENLTFSKHDDKILITTASNWLTEIEYRRNKIFVTKRIKLMDGKPVDFDFGDGSIAVLNDNNTISLTSNTPESIVIHKFDGEYNEESSDESSISSSSSQVFHSSDESNTEDYSEVEASDLQKINSMTFENDIDNSSDSDFLSTRNSYKSDMMNHGNSNSFSLSFNVHSRKDEVKVKHVNWISTQKLVAWCKKSLYLIDLKTRKVTEPLLKKFDNKSISITQVFFSKSYKMIVLILSSKQVYFLDTESNLEIINSIDFSDKIKKDSYSLIGSISPKGDQVVFASKNILFFFDLNENKFVNQIYSSLGFRATFISWQNRGIYIGTEKGSAFLITKKKLAGISSMKDINIKDIKVIYEKKRLGPIKQISSCSKKSYAILDTNNQGILVSNNNATVTTIAENIKYMKQFSKEGFLLRLLNYNKLIAINVSGDFSPSSPPCFYASLTKMIKDDVKKNENNLINQIFSTNANNLSVSLRNSVELLNQILSLHDPFNSLSSKTFLKLGNLEKARDLLLKTDPSDKEYLNNMMLAALYNSHSNKSESVQLVVDNLLSNNLVNEAVDILLITKNIYSAAEILSNYGRNKDAYHVLMLNDYKNESDIEKNLVQKIASSLINKKENVLFGLKLLSSFGCIHELMNQFSLNVL